MTVKSRESRTDKIDRIFSWILSYPLLSQNIPPQGGRKHLGFFPWTLVLISVLVAKSALKLSSEDVGLSSLSEHPDES